MATLIWKEVKRMATYDGKIKNTGGQVVKGPYATHEGRVKGTVHKGGDMRTVKK